jgi:uncharacterized protein YllA (UPF0747 family)
VRNEPPFERLYDPIVHDVVHAGPFARERFATLWPDTPALTRLAAAKRRRLSAPLTDALVGYHRRLGAPEAALRSIDRLGRGEVVCAVAGQQPAPLLGPLYALHKAASAVALASAVERRTGVACVPLFWMHGEDSDFAEIRGATLADRNLQLRDLALPDGAHREGGLVGGIPASLLAPLHAEAVTQWAELPGVEDTRRVLEFARERAADLGEVTSVLMLALFGERGLVVVDPRLPAFRADARSILERYLAHAEPLSAAVRRAGSRVEQNLGRRPLADAALDSFVFAIEDGARHKISVDEARRHSAAGGTLSPSVALRPVIQDGVFPTVAMACGAAELAYLAQIREVFDALDVHAASPVPRLTATWLPPPARALLEAAGVEPWTLVTGSDAVLRQLAEQTVPPAVRVELEAARRGAEEALARFAEASRAVDASLPQMVESARGKVDYQFARLEEGVAGKARHRLERQHPEWVRLRYYLLPGDRLQERRIASLEAMAYRGRAVAAELCDLAGAQLDLLERSLHEHLLLEL